MADDPGHVDQNSLASSSDSVPWLSDDKFYRGLASGERRRLLYFLLDRGESTVEEVATVLAGWEVAETGGMGTKDDRDRFVIALEHVHLPLLADAGLVTYDRQTGTVAIDSVDPFVADLIRHSVESGRPNS